jgi:hypothetical protein
MRKMPWYACIPFGEDCYALNGLVQGLVLCGILWAVWG